MNLSLPKTTESIPNTWKHYWNQDPFWAESKIWSINAKLFCERAASLLNFNSADRILDFGCGSGETAFFLAPQVAFYKGVDSSKALLEKARQRNKTIPFETTSQPFDTEKYSIFLAVSVIQYFSSIEQVIDLVRKFQSCAQPNAHILLADIPQPRSFAGRLLDFAGSIAQAAKEGYLIEYIKLLFRVPFSFYGKFSKANPILEIPIRELNNEFSQLGFKTQIINQSLSICAHRPSLLIQL